MSRWVEFALRCVATEFAAMHNPRYRGAKFSWETFPERMARKVEAELFLYYTDARPASPDLKRKAGELARKFAKDLIREESGE